VAWVDGGAREGDPKDLPPLPKYTEGWRIGTPDEKFSIPEQTVPADGVVAYQYLTMPTNFKEDRSITAAQIRSTGHEVGQHVIVVVRAPGALSRVEGEHLVGFARGEQQLQFPPGFGKRIPAGSNLLFQVHYTPNGTGVKDTTTVGLIYAKTPIKNT